MLANILRTAILAASAALPENAPVVNVVFASSIQIVIAVAYFFVYTMVTAAYRVLSTREAMHDPAMQREVVFNVDDGLDDEDMSEYDDSFHKPVARSKLQALRDLRDALHREADRFASRVFLSHAGLSQQPVVNLREISCDDGFSESSQNSQPEKKPRVEAEKDFFSRRDKGTTLPHAKSETSTEGGVSELQVAGVFPDANVSQVRDSCEKTVCETQNARVETKETSRAHHYTPSNFVPNEPVDGASVHVYSEVYALGLSVFIIHYCLDAASMNPTMFLLIGLTVLALKDELRKSDATLDEILTLVRALSVAAFLLMVAAQICMLVGIARVPTYHTFARDGGILQVPAPATVLEIILAIVMPLHAPLSLYLIGRRRSAQHVSRLVRTAMPCTVLVALWFITCFGAMNDQIRNKLGVESVNVTVTALTTIDDKQIPMLLFAPFLKVPALLCIISCCLSGKTIDIVCAMALTFYAKQHNAVRDGEMQQMLVVALIFAAVSWTMCTLRYWSWLMQHITRFFDR
jgi:hypothetical protein